MALLRAISALLGLAALVSGCIRLKDEPNPWPCHTQDDCHGTDKCMSLLSGRQVCEPADFCEDSSQCSGGDLCVDSKCVPPKCTPSNESACGGYHCVVTVCLNSCTNDFACREGYLCLNNECKKPEGVGDVCQEDKQCSSGNCCASAVSEVKTCTVAPCHLVAEGGQCVTDDICVTKHCANGTCAKCTAGDCAAKVCGDHDCGVIGGVACGTCAAPNYCDSTQHCQGACVTRQCGMNQGVDCGSCSSKQYCSDDGQCVEACVGLQCGQDHGVLCPGCVAGSYCDVDQQCKDFQTCKPGTYILQPGNLDADRTCQPCASGSFSASENALKCLPWTQCNGIESKPPSAATDRECYGGWIDVEGGTTQAETAFALVTLPDGDVIYGGWRDLKPNQPLGNVDEVAYLRRFDVKFGEQQWEVTTGTASLNRVTDLAFDGVSNLYVAGYGYSDDGAGYIGAGDGWLKKVDITTGKDIWAHALGTAGFDLAWSVALAPDGNVVVTGFSEGALAGPRVATGNGSDFFVFKLSKTDGSVLWKTQFGPGSGDGVSVDKNGDVIVGGWGTLTVADPESADSRVALVKLSGKNGAQIWSKRYGTDANDELKDVAVDANGDAYAKIQGIFTARVEKYSGATGARVWSREVAKDLGAALKSGIAVTAQNTLLVTGFATGDLDGEGTTEGGYVSELSLSDGKSVWVEQWDGQDTGYDVTSTANGDIYICGSTEIEINDPPDGHRQTISLLAKIVRP